MIYQTSGCGDRQSGICWLGVAPVVLFFVRSLFHHLNTQAYYITFCQSKLLRTKMESIYCRLVCKEFHLDILRVFRRWTPCARAHFTPPFHVHITLTYMYTKVKYKYSRRHETVAATVFIRT